MKAMIYAALLVAAALLTMSCKENEQTQPDNDDVTIFKVEAKSVIETSPEDAAWQNCDTKQEVASRNFIQMYICKFNGFKCGFTHQIEWWDGETHEHKITGMPLPLKDHQWVESIFDISSFRMQFQADYNDRDLVSGGDRYLSNIVKFNEIAEQNNDNNYNGYYWNEYLHYSYIPTECVNIECVQNYDAAHPAGTLLNDIAVVDYNSAETFIRSGYKNNRASDFCKFARRGILPEPLSEFNKKQVNMIDGLSFMVSLTQGPAVEGVYNFKLTYKDISGEVRTATTIPIRLATK